MKSLWRRGFWLLGLIVCVTSCGFDGDVMRKYLPSEVSDAPSVYNERNILFCAVSIYELSENADFESLPLSKPSQSTTEWQRLPLDGNIETDFAVQALFNGDECFDSEAQRITGLSRLSEYYSSERQGFFIELRHDLVLVHDTALNSIIISSRAR